MFSAAVQKLCSRLSAATDFMLGLNVCSQWEGLRFSDTKQSGLALRRITDSLYQEVSLSGGFMFIFDGYYSGHVTDKK